MAALGLGPGLGGQQLQDLRVEDVEETGKELGRGSYGVVVELKVSGLLCAGKTLHERFFTFGSPEERRLIEERFVQECLRLSRLRHPNVVQLLGVHFEQAGYGSRVPMLVMEFLPMTLTQCIERHEELPDSLKCSILLDAGLGLLYLHRQRPAILHRDLTANNILLTASLQGKIADLGVATIVNLNAEQVSARMTMCPGLPAYMPPEALSDRPAYDTSLDCFSFGCLIVHTCTQRWPLPLPILRHDPNNPGQLRPRTEVERRAEFLEAMSADSPRQLAERCLDNIPGRRPSAADIVQELQHLTAAHPLPFGSIVEVARAMVPVVPQQNVLQETASHNLLELNSTIEWRRCPDLPQGVKLGSAVVLNGKVYWGGGDTSSQHTHSAPSRYVQVYDFTNGQQWDHLPPLTHEYFTLAAYRGTLVAVGGWDAAGRDTTNEVLVWDTGSSMWIGDQLPLMPTSRCEASALGYNQYLVVAGGWTGSAVLDTVEVLDGDTRIWSRAPPLPVPAKMSKTAFHDGYWYLMGGDMYTAHFSINSASIDDLVTSINAPQPRGQHHPSPWTTMTGVPVKCPPIAVWGSTLVALGGLDTGPSNEVIRSPKIHAYCPHTKSWQYIGDMPTRGSAHCAVGISTGELMVIGGRCTDAVSSVKDVFKACVVPTRK